MDQKVFPLKMEEDEPDLSTMVTPFLTLRDSKLEKLFQLHILKTRISGWSMLLMFVVISLNFFLYWTHILIHHYQIGSVILFVISMSIVLVSNPLVALALLCTKPEDVLGKRWIHFAKLAMGYGNLFCYGAILYFQSHRHLCHPMHMVLSFPCDKEDFPADVVLGTIFLPLAIILGFPCFPWMSSLILYVCCVAVALYFSTYYYSAQEVPLLVIGVLFSFGSMYVGRADALRSFLLHIRIDREKERSHRLMQAEKLRIMISGVAHDLKSVRFPVIFFVSFMLSMLIQFLSQPLSALSLGCEQLMEIYKRFADIIHDSKPCSEGKQIREELLASLKDVSTWMSTSKKSMTTIISRCVDVNRTLNGFRITPNVKLVNIRDEINNLVKFYRQENSQVIINVSMNLERTDGLLEDMIQTDRLWLQESISCMLSNAVKFRDSSSLSTNCIDVMVTTVNKDKTLVYDQDQLSARTSAILVEVHDRGVGVDANAKDLLFSFQGHSQQNRVGGTGLGLYALACRVNALGGSYGYYPRQSGSGSVFWIEVPCVQTEQAAASKSRENFSRGWSNSSVCMQLTSKGNSVCVSPHSSSHITNNSYHGSVGKTVQYSVSSSATSLMPEPLSATITIHENESLKASVSAADDASLFEVLSARSGESRSRYSGTHPKRNKTSLRNGTDTSKDGNIERTESKVYESERSSSSAATESMLPPLRILVVDDSLPIRKMCSMILKQQHHTVTTAMNGKEALQLMTASMTLDRTISIDSKTGDNMRDFDVVLMDIQMPVMDGIEAVSLYREQEAIYRQSLLSEDPENRFAASMLQPLPIVGMSACSDNEIIDRALEVGMDHFVSKPFHISHFNHVVRSVTKRSFA